MPVTSMSLARSTASASCSAVGAEGELAGDARHDRVGDAEGARDGDGRHAGGGGLDEHVAEPFAHRRQQHDGVRVEVGEPVLDPALVVEGDSEPFGLGGHRVEQRTAAERDDLGRDAAAVELGRGWIASSGRFWATRRQGSTICRPPPRSGHARARGPCRRPSRSRGSRPRCSARPRRRSRSTSSPATGCEIAMTWSARRYMRRAKPIFTLCDRSESARPSETRLRSLMITGGRRAWG